MADGTAYKVFFLLLGAAVIYTYALYPLVLGFLSRFFSRSGSLVNQAVAPDVCASQTFGSGADLPMLSVIVAAHNEESVIGARVENVFACDYPRDRLEFIVISDGSTDGTEAIVAACLPRFPGLRLLSHSPNRGKAFALNQALPQAKGEVAVLSDANTSFAPGALRQLVGRLQARDGPIAVCGKLILRDPDTGDNVDSLYWRYESWLKAREGELGATLGANGGIYAFRRADYIPIADNTIVDDFTIPLLMKLHHGGNVVFSPDAVAEEWAPEQMADEFGRRVRIGTGAYQSLMVLWPLLHPRYGFTAFAFFSHKVLRWLAPFCLLGMLVLVLLGINQLFFQLIAVTAVAFASLLYQRKRFSQRGLMARLLGVLAMFLSMNAALALGFWRWLLRPQSGTWSRTER